MNTILSVKKPTSPLPLVFDSPHSGAHYPKDFGYACDFETLKQAEDQHVDDLFANATNHGGHLLLAHFPRSYIDVNRSCDDIDLQLLNEPWTGPTANPTSRSDAGIGLIRRLVKPGVPVYDRALSSEEILTRIEKYYRPYHEKLADLIEEAHYNFGQAWHINCHSMPHSSAYPKHGIGLIGNTARPSDFVLGDRDGTACDPNFTRALRDFIRKLGYTVTINDPFKGVELVERYSNPTRGYNSIQIEINKSLYMDEETGKKTPGYTKLKSDLDSIMAFMTTHIQSRLVNLAAD